MACVVGALFAVSSAPRDKTEQAAREERQARDELPASARSFADQVIGAAHGRSGPNDAALYDLATHPRDRCNAAVWVVARVPDLTLIVRIWSAYVTLFGSGHVDGCFRLAFHDLGGLAARYDMDVADPCPPGPPLQRLGPSASVTQLGTY